MRTATLDDKYARVDGEIYLSGVQALVRLLLEQRRRDADAGLNTAGFVSGYRGSPLGGVDLALWQSRALLDEAGIRFEPGLNEELAATMVHGSQQVRALGGARVDGVFGLWYAKNPGVDRSGDALKHANAAGTTEHGGVLAVSGDDPGAATSTVANQSDHAFMSAGIPVLAPASVEEILDLGLAGIAMSRHAGVWVGLKLVADVVEASASVRRVAGAPRFACPDEPPRPLGGWGLRWPDSRWDQDARLANFRLPAARAFARANRLDRVVFGAARPRVGIVSVGKAHGDVMDALAQMGIDAAAAEAMGLAVYKVSMPWPLEPVSVREFAEGLDEVLVVEERRAVVEPQLKEQAYGWARRPRIVGKADEAGAALLPEVGVLEPWGVARAIARRLRPSALPERPAPPCAVAGEVPRGPHFCAGCPHARSTRVPEGSLAMAGIGCHSLRLGMPASGTMFMVQMGGEGSNWLGAAPFVERGHVFQNLGDGTYTHSGSLAVRAAVAAKARVTYRILYNRTVAMTGGQPAEGELTLPQIVRQLQAEGVARVEVVAEEPAQWRGALPPGVALHGRDAMERVQRELRELDGVTAIVYDQRCATEKRRLRKRGALPPVASRLVIHERVCEGCGDCMAQSQCAALRPVATPFGRKRRIDASSCNADESCLQGLCPSFVRLEGAVPRARAAAGLDLPPLPEPVLPAVQDAGEIVVTGIGGTGVVTIGALLGMAAHLQGYGVSVLDNTGIARKGGAVSSHVRLSAAPGAEGAARIADGAARLLIGGDLVVSAEAAVRAKLSRDGCRVVLNADAVPTPNQALDPDAAFDPAPLRQALEREVAALHALPASRLAEALLGDAVFANLVLLGAAWQLGALPLTFAALDRAIELNGGGVEANRRAFALGRAAVAAPQRLAAWLGDEEPPAPSLDERLAQLHAELVDYQDERYAGRHAALVARVREAEAAAGASGDAFAGGGSRDALALAVAEGFYRLLAVKDEYEVARLLSDPAFEARLRERFDGDWRMHLHLAPPLFARPDPATGRPRKRRYGPWVMPLLRGLARARRLRGTALDVFGRSDERRDERQLARDYEQWVEAALRALASPGGGDAGRQALALELASLPQQARGYGSVKAAAIVRARQRAAQILAALEGR